MNGILVAPARLIQGRTFVGQAPSGPMIPVGDHPKKSNERVVLVKEFTDARYTPREAIAAYKAARFYLSVHAKVSFMALAYSDIANIPGGSGALAGIDQSKRSAIEALVKFAKILSIPERLQTMKNLTVALESVILPNMGIVPRAKFPMVVDVPGVAIKSSMSYSTVNHPMLAILTESQKKMSVLDLGDLTATTVVADIESSESAVNDISQLGIPPAILMAIGITIAALGITLAVAFGAWSLKSIFQSAKLSIGEIMKDPDLAKWFKELDPKVQAGLLGLGTESNGFFGQLSGLIQTIAIVGVIGLAGFFTYKIFS